MLFILYLNHISIPWLNYYAIKYWFIDYVPLSYYSYCLLHYDQGPSLILRHLHHTTAGGISAILALLTHYHSLVTYRPISRKPAKILCAIAKVSLWPAAFLPTSQVPSICIWKTSYFLRYVLLTRIFPLARVD